MDDKSGLVMIQIGGLFWDMILCVLWIYTFHT